MPARIAAATFASALLLATGCSSEPTRSDVLAGLAATTIVVTYEQLATDGEALATAATNLCQQPSTESIGAANEALAAMRDTWSMSEAMWVGPIEERRSWGRIDWPIDRTEIDDLIADPTVPLDPDRLASGIAADQRGLGAVEHVLGDPTEPAAALDALDDERRCTYLTGVTTVIGEETAVLAAAWTADSGVGEPWRETFADPETASIDMLVNDALFVLEDITDRELGPALDGTEARIDPIAEGPAGLGTTDIAGHLRGLRAVLIGPPEVAPSGLSELLGQDLTDRLTTAFDSADEAIAAIDTPLRTALVERPDLVTEARAAIKQLQVIVGTEVVSRLGVTIGFSDADGDTGS